MVADWSAPPRPAAYAEKALIDAILDGVYPPGSTLPGERDLAARLGVTRPTLREALQRLGRDGWLRIQQGKPTQVKDVWREGGLGVLGALVRHPDRLPPDFVPNLLEVRLALAPVYARAAVACAPQEIVAYLAQVDTLPDDAQALATFDWGLHFALTVASRNPVFTLILNGFGGFYQEMAARYFAQAEARASSRAFYVALLDAAQRGDAPGAERVTYQTMLDSLELWHKSREEGAER